MEKDKGWIDWRRSAAKEIVLEDMDCGGWLYGEEDMDLSVVFAIYKHNHEEFQDVPFDHRNGNSKCVCNQIF